MGLQELDTTEQLHFHFSLPNMGAVLVYAAESLEDNNRIHLSKIRIPPESYV